MAGSDLDQITSCVIHPAIGIARVGNSQSGYFIGPEGPSWRPGPEQRFKDEDGRVKRQVARFRIYGLDSDNRSARPATRKPRSAKKVRAAAIWWDNIANHTSLDYLNQGGGGILAKGDCLPDLELRHEGDEEIGVVTAEISAVDAGHESIGEQRRLAAVAEGGAEMTFGRGF